MDREKKTDVDPRGKKNKKHQALKILLPLSAFNHSRSSGDYDRSGIFPSSPLKCCDLCNFSPSATVPPCGRVNVAMGNTSCPTTLKLDFFSPPF